MTESEALARMISPGMRRPGKPRNGVIQILVTSACNLSCYGCTQASNLQRPLWFMTPDQFEQAVVSLQGYFGVIGVFGGCPCISPHFEDYCAILRRHVPQDRCGLWSNNLMGKGAACRTTFSPAVSNLNVHLDQAAYDEMRRDWPESRPFGLHDDSRHSPPWVAMKDVLKKPCNHCHPLSDGTPSGRQIDQFGGTHVCDTCNGTGKVYDESAAWELISRCPINQHWSALIGVFRGQLRAWFCEIAGAQSVLHQHEPDYPDTGYDPTRQYYMPADAVAGVTSAIPVPWWQLRMSYFADQVRKHCHSCGVPLQGHGELAQAQDGTEQVSRTHSGVYRPKRKDRRVQLVTVREELGKPLERMTAYIENGRIP